MAYKQLVTPNINIGATAGYCLGYVDDALNAPVAFRSYSAQIAYNTAKYKGWVRNNQNYPVNVWFVMFWSIDNSPARGLGHVALAYYNGSSLQIHDSEVHRGARNPYGSLSELNGWFGSVGTQLTYLGWSIGVDGVVLLQEYDPNANKNTNTNTNTRKGVATMYAIYWIPNAKGTGKDAYYFNGVSFEYIGHPDSINILKQIYKDNNGKNMPEYTWENGAPWWIRLNQPIVNLQEMADRVAKIEKKVNTLK